MKTENGKYTPGPWYVAGEQSGVTEYSDTRHIYAQADKDAGGTGCVACVASSTANAALIAAAPDMLEALRELLSDEYLSDPVNGDRMASARAAVLKVTGEEFGMPFTYPLSAPIWRDGKPVDPADVPLPVRKRIHWAARDGDAFIVHDGAEWQWD